MLKNSLDQVGDIIHLREDQEVPCDCIVLTSSHVQVNTHHLILLHIWICLILRIPLKPIWANIHLILLHILICLILGILQITVFP